MSQQELQTFHSELVVAGSSMQMSLKSKQDANFPVDPDWVHKVRTKMHACDAFRTRIEAMLDQGVGSGALKQMISQRLEQLLIDEIGERLYRELQAEARDLALEDLQAQIPDA